MVGIVVAQDGDKGIGWCQSGLDGKYHFGMLHGGDGYRLWINHEGADCIMMASTIHHERVDWLDHDDEGVDLM